MPPTGDFEGTERHDKEASLKQFDVEWERRRPEKSKQVLKLGDRVTPPGELYKQYFRERLQN